MTGHRPIEGSTAFERLELLQLQDPVRPGKWNAKIDRDLETICLKCLEKLPERRYKTAAAMADDLERWLAGKPVEARPVRSIERAWRWCRRNPWLACLTATALCLLAVTLVTLSTSIVLLQAEQKRTEQEKERSENANRKLRLRLYPTEIRQAAAAHFAGNYERMRMLLDGWSGPEDEKVRGFEWHFLRRLAEDFARAYCRVKPAIEGNLAVWEHLKGLGGFTEMAGPPHRRTELPIRPCSLDGLKNRPTSGWSSLFRETALVVQRNVSDHET